jgi:hypothetical protein
MHPTEPSTTMTPGYPGLQNPPPAKGRVALGRAFEDVNTLKIILLSYKLSAFHTTSVSYVLMTCVKFTLFMNRHELCMRKKNLAYQNTLRSRARQRSVMPIRPYEYSSTKKLPSDRWKLPTSSKQYEETSVRSMEVTYKFKAVRRNFRPMDGSYPQVQVQQALRP